MNEVNIHVNLCEGTATTLPAEVTAQEISFRNAEGTVRELAATAKDADHLDAMLTKQQIPSVKVNPFLSRPIDMGAMSQIIGDGCILLPPVFGGPGAGPNPFSLRKGQTTGIGVISSEKGVFYNSLQRTTGGDDGIKQGDTFQYRLQNAAGHVMMERELSVAEIDKGEGKGGGTIQFKPRKCDCFTKIPFSVPYKGYGPSVEFEWK